MVDGLPHLDIDLCWALNLFPLIKKSEVCRPFLSAPLRPRDKKVRADVNQPKYHILSSKYCNKNPWNQCGSFLFFLRVQILLQMLLIYLPNIICPHSSTQNFLAEWNAMGAARLVGMFQPSWVTDPCQKW